MIGYPLEGGSDRVILQMRSALRICSEAHIVLGSALAAGEVYFKPGQPLAVALFSLRLLE